MSPVWASQHGWSLYLYADEPHRVPHVQVRGADFRASIRISDGAVLAGAAPPRVIREVRVLIARHRDLATEAFHATLDHRFPGTLDDMLADPKGGPTRTEEDHDGQ